MHNIQQTYNDFGGSLNADTDKDYIRAISTIRRVLFEDTETSNAMSLRLLAV